MNHKVIASTLTICAVVAGCAAFEAPSQPTPEQIQGADYALPPDSAAIRPAINKWNEDNLKDPSSVQMRKLSEPEKGWVTVCTQPGVPPYNYCTQRMFYFGYLVKAEINAKNSYGGYNGFKEWTYLFRGDSISRVVTP